MVGKDERELCVRTYMKRKLDVGEMRLKKIVLLDSKEEILKRAHEL